METFLAVLLALGIYVVIPVLIGLLICTAGILYSRSHHKVENTKDTEEAEDMVERTSVKKEDAKVG